MKNNIFTSRKYIVVLHDIAVIVVAFYGAYLLRFNLEGIPPEFLTHANKIFPIVFVIQALVFWKTGLYRGVWRFASIPDLYRIFKAVIIGTMAALLGVYLTGNIVGVPRSIFLIQGILLILFLGGSRFSLRLLKERHLLLKQGKRSLIIGAGQAGEGLVRDLLRSNQKEFNPIAFLDDKVRRKNQEIHGVRVVGTCSEIKQVAERYNIEQLIIAIPSANSKELREIISYTIETNLPVFTLPAIKGLVSSNIDHNQVREISIEDLLGRAPVELDNIESLSSLISGKVILVTGAGGSIGRELSMQIAEYSPQKIILIDNCESNLFYIEQDLKTKYTQQQIQVNLLDIRFKKGLEQVISSCRPHIVFHAAAYKHVPMLEENLREAVKNNIFGTKLVAELSAKYNVGKFILISTDKAVNPTNVMGLTKRVAEIICQNFKQTPEQFTKFMTVRFGNVLDSVGSVVPTFRKQIKAGGPITLTDPEITRFFMTIQEAATLVLSAASIGDGNEIFVLDMGEPIKIDYLANQMIRLSGKELGLDIDIKYIGLRPGEKLYEELFYNYELKVKTSHEKIMKAQRTIQIVHNLDSTLNKMERACLDNDVDYLKQLLDSVKSEYILQKSDEQLV